MTTRAIKGKADPRDVVRQAQVDDRVRRALPPRVDPTGACHAAVVELASEHGLDVADLLEQWSERAACRTYLGGATQAESERLAVEDVRESVRRRTA